MDNRLLVKQNSLTMKWGRLRDICVSDDGKIYLATNGNTWPSQPPNEIIELSNANYNIDVTDIKTKDNKKKGRKIL